MEELEIILEQETNEETIINLETENSGGTGTSNYNELFNKPKINGIELKGDKTTQELGIEAGKEVHIGADEPTDEDVVIWIDPTEEADKIPTKTSELENDSGFLDHKGIFNEWSELNSYEFKTGTTFLFDLQGTFASYMGTCLCKYSDFKSGENYVYKYIKCFNINTQQSFDLDLLNKTITVNQMPIQDENDYFTSTGLDDILQEIGGQLNGLEELLGGI
jgi:hypothetical protein